MAIRDVAVAGGMVRVETAGEEPGRAAGPALIFLHGWTLDRTIWHPQMEALAARFLVAALDRRGFGESSAPPALSLEADDLITVADRLGIDRFVLVGMSQGGRVALRFAIDRGDRLAGLVLAGAPLDGFHPQPRGDEAIPMDGYAAMVRAGRLDAMKAAWRAHPLMQCGAGAGLLDRYEGRDLMQGGGSLAPPAAELDRVDVPTLVVTGAEDTPWRRLVGDALAYGIAGARRETVPGGHLCNLTHPGAFNAVLADFAGGLSQPQ